MSRNFSKLALVLGMLIFDRYNDYNCSKIWQLRQMLLYWTTATFNASVETRLSSKWTLDVSAGYNPFTFSDNEKVEAILPFSLRHAIGSVLHFSGHFVGANLLYSHYNAGGVKMPFGNFFRP